MPEQSDDRCPGKKGGFGIIYTPQMGLPIVLRREYNALKIASSFSHFRLVILDIT